MSPTANTEIFVMFVASRCMFVRSTILLAYRMTRSSAICVLYVGVTFASCTSESIAQAISFPFFLIGGRFGVGILPAR